MKMTDYNSLKYGTDLCNMPIYVPVAAKASFKAGRMTNGSDAGCWVQWVGPVSASRKIIEIYV